MIHVIAEISLRDGARERFVAEFVRLTPLVRAERGCIEYQGATEVRTDIAVQLPVRNDVFTVIEKWSDVSSLKQHLAAPHMAEHRERVKDLTSGTTIRVLRSA